MKNTLSSNNLTWFIKIADVQSMDKSVNVFVWALRRLQHLGSYRDGAFLQEGGQKTAFTVQPHWTAIRVSTSYVTDRWENGYCYEKTEVSDIFRFNFKTCFITD